MRKALPGAILILAVCLTAGCGGGGGGGSVSGLSYTGLTSQAAIDNNNAETIAIQVYQAGDMSSTLTAPMGDSATPAAAAHSPKVAALVRTLKSVVDQAAAASAGSVSAMSRSGAAPMAEVPYNDTIYDGLGGSATVSLVLDDATGYFTGAFVFQDWHADANTVMSGTTTVAGYIDLLTGGFTDISYSFASFTISDGGGSVTVAGTVELVNNPPNAIATVNLVFRDNVTGKTVWIRDYILSMLEGPDGDLDGIPDYVAVTVSGRVYLHDYGSNNITTQDSLIIGAGEINPSSGALIFTGSGGRSIRFTVIDELTGFFVEADLEPDGFYEWTSVDHPWQ